MRSVFKTVAGLTVATLVFLFLGIRFTLDAIGYTTSPDDLALLQARLPKVLEWLFSTPWWVPSLFMAGMIVLAGWLLVAGLRGIAVEPSPGEPRPITADDVEASITRRIGELQPSSGGVTSDYVDAAIKLRLGNMFRDTVAETFEASDGRAGSMIEHFEKRCDQLSDAIQSVAGANAAVTNGIMDEIKEIRKNATEWERKFEGWSLNRADDLDRRFDNVDQSIQSIYYREWHHRLFRELDTDFEALVGPVEAGGGIENWDEWDAEEKRWRGRLEQWLTIVDFFARASASAINEIPDGQYYGPWRCNLSSLNADQTRRFKELVIRWHNAKEVKPRIDKCFDRACFFGASKIGRLGPPPPSLE